MHTPSRKLLVPLVALLVGLAVGVVLSSTSSTARKSDRREPRDDGPAPAGQRIVAEPLPSAAKDDGPVNPAYRFEDDGRVYYISVTPGTVVVRRVGSSQ